MLQARVKFVLQALISSSSVGLKRLTKPAYIVRYAGVWLILLIVMSALDGLSMLGMTSFMFTRTDSANHLFKAFVFVGTWSAAFVGFAVMISHHFKWVRLTAYIYLTICVATQFSLLLSRSQYFSLNEAFLLMHNADFFSEALEEYAADILLGMLGALILTAGLWFLVGQLKVRTRSITALLLFPLATFGSYLVIQQSHGRISAFPIVRSESVV